MPGERSGKERVLRVARDLFLERGYAEVSMQQIADAAGLRKASIYHHVKDKQALFVEIILTEMRDLRRRMEELVSGEGTLREQLERLARAQFDEFRPDVLRLSRDFREHVPEQCHDEVHGELEGLADLFSGVFERAARTGELRDIPPRLAGLCFFHIVAAWSFHAADDPGLPLPDPETAARLATEIMLYGVAAQPPGQPPAS